MPPLGKILLTTSREPTAKIRTLCNDLARVIPNTVRVNRGKMSTDDVAEKALEIDAERVVVIDRRQGGPGTIKFFKVEESGLVSIPPVVHVRSITLSRELGVSGVKPAVSLVMQPTMTSKEISKLAGALSKFLDVPILLMGTSFENGCTIMTISCDETDRTVITFMSDPEHEVGPRIVVSSLEWEIE